MMKRIRRSALPQYDGVRNRRCIDDIVGAGNVKSPASASLLLPAKEKRYLNSFNRPFESHSQTIHDRFKSSQAKWTKPRDYFAQLKQKFEQKHTDFMKAQESKRSEKIVPFKSPARSAQSETIKKVVNNIQDLLPDESEKDEFKMLGNYKNDRKYLQDNIRSYLNTNYYDKNKADVQSKALFNEPSQPSAENVMAAPESPDFTSESKEVEYLINEYRKSPQQIPIADIKALLKNHLQKVNGHQHHIPGACDCREDSENIFKMTQGCCQHCKEDIMKYIEEKSCNCQPNHNNIRSHIRRAEPSDATDVCPVGNQTTPELELSLISTGAADPFTSSSTPVNIFPPDVSSITNGVDENPTTASIDLATTSPDILMLINQLKEKVQGANIIVELPVDSTITNFAVTKEEYYGAAVGKPLEIVTEKFSRDFIDMVNYLRENTPSTARPTVGPIEEKIYESIKTYIREMNARTSNLSVDQGESAAYESYLVADEHSDARSENTKRQANAQKLKKSRKRYLLRDLEEYESVEELSAEGDEENNHDAEIEPEYRDASSECDEEEDGEEGDADEKEDGKDPYNYDGSGE